MKFLPIALTAFFAGIVSAKKKVPISTNTLQKRLAQGKFDKRALVRNSQPYDDHTKARLAQRKLDQGDDGEFEIDGSYSVSFNECLNVKIENENLLDDELLYYAKNEMVLATKSYIIFSICETDNCYYDEEDMSLTFVTDLPSFVGAFIEYLPNQAESYCNGCQENEDYCMGNMQQDGEDDYYYYNNGDAANQDGDGDGEDEQEDGDGDQEEEDGDGNEQDEEEDEDQQEEQENEDQDNEQEDEGEDDQEGEDNQEDEGEGEDRKLMKSVGRILANNQIYEYINCELCETYECYEVEDNDGENDGEEEYELEDAVEWLQQLTECVEIEDAQWHDLGLMSGMICNEAGNGIEIGVFVDDECTIFAPSLSYSNYISYENQQYYALSEEYVEYMFTNDIDCLDQEITYINPYTEINDDGNQDDNGEEEEVAEASEFCKGLFEGDFEPRNLEDCSADENADDYQYQNQDANNEYNYDWYTYELSEEQLDDGYEVCTYIQGLEGEYSTYYDSESGGTLYNYEKKSQGSNYKFDLPPGAIVGIAIATAVIVGCCLACWLRVDWTKPDPKKVPLVHNEDATSA